MTGKKLTQVDKIRLAGIRHGLSDTWEHGNGLADVVDIITRKAIRRHIVKKDQSDVRIWLLGILEQSYRVSYKHWSRSAEWEDILDSDGNKTGKKRITKESLDARDINPVYADLCSETSYMLTDCYGKDISVFDYQKALTHTMMKCAKGIVNHFGQSANHSKTNNTFKHRDTLDVSDHINISDTKTILLYDKYNIRNLLTAIERVENTFIRKADFIGLAILENLTVFDNIKKADDYYSDTAIISRLGIPRATYYRRKKAIRESIKAIYYQLDSMVVPDIEIPVSDKTVIKRVSIERQIDAIYKEGIIIS